MEINGKTELYGVIGNPVKHSLSPVFQNVGFKSLGINAVYLPLEVSKERFEESVRGLLSLENLKGFNVTVPFKEGILKFGDLLSEDVKHIGSANTLKKTPEGRIEFYNTDWVGFLNALKELTDPAGKKVLVLGAGGTSRAVIYALKRVNAEVFLWNRTLSKAEKLAQSFGVKIIKNLNNIGVFEIIVNTTSVGLKEDDPPLFDYEKIQAHQVVYDVIYRQTPLVETALKKGAKAQNGLKMLLYQGVESFKIWTGKEPPIGTMWRALKRAFTENHARKS
ncbi:MAG TPA: shikimate dehydrogenase [Aquifex aeolicus]|uniref:Shikimate dehydrogenase (NADP(+)) n=1 Tax=Aquifex aeolicus TaxID=63363 RepID=A0A9D0YPY9_AQUAO|nr:shikimate dehydrogenase [Aquifex aeolicus]